MALLIYLLNNWTLLAPSVRYWSSWSTFGTLHGDLVAKLDSLISFSWRHFKECVRFNFHELGYR